MKSRFAANAFDGEGACLYGGRWSSPGTRVVYASETLALATLEVLVHLQRTAVLSSYSVASAHFDERIVTAVDPASLPANWTASPFPPELVTIGNRWVMSQTSAVLKVPSAIIMTESNYLLNPQHPDFATVVIDPVQPFVLDSRLLSK